MNRYVGKICPYCKSEFTENDDIVVCSNCDMPHHKECWIQNDGCTTFGCLGTMKSPDDNPSAVTTQLDIDDLFSEDKLYCSRCGCQNKVSANFCYRCGSKLDDLTIETNISFNNYNENIYDYSDNSSFNSLIGENESYYANKFQEIKNQNKETSWNWSAFLFAPYWFIYRKMYKYGIAFIGITALLTLINSVLFSCVSILGYILVGLYGNFIYMKWLEKKIATNNVYGQNQSQNLLKYKGVNQLASALAVVGSFFLYFIIMLL